MNEIYINKHLEVGKYYHCFDKVTGFHSIQHCFIDGTAKFMGPNTIWAEDDNNQALGKWRIIGPIELPKLDTIYLCNDHGGLGFVSDCATCQSTQV